MIQALRPSEIEKAFIEACRLEVRSLKPGNVHVFASGHGMQVADFEKSAAVAAPHIANPALSVGQRIRRAVDATFAAVNCNTNLGIVLLCAPLAFAAETPVTKGQTFHQTLKRVLAALTAEDTTDVFAAIARATPGGLGTANDGDVRRGPAANMTLMRAMALAQDRDLIARAYVTGFDRIFALETAEFAPRLSDGWHPEDALARVFVSELARVADTHIARKYGAAKAEEVRATAARLEVDVFRKPSARPSDPEQHQALLKFDADLKAAGLNPGTLADFVAAVAFISNLKAAAKNVGTVL
jgi:triphosphoribosyl-dephospho-CoA synthase